MDLAKLRRMIRLCQTWGVKHIKTEGVELDFWSDVVVKTERGSGVRISAEPRLTPEEERLIPVPSLTDYPTEDDFLYMAVEDPEPSAPTNPEAPLQ